jgi:hypothetical protein
MGNEQKKRIHSCSKFLDGTNGMVMPSWDRKAWEGVIFEKVKQEFYFRHAEIKHLLFQTPSSPGQHTGPCPWGTLVSWEWYGLYQPTTKDSGTQEGPRRPQSTILCPAPQ